MPRLSRFLLHNKPFDDAGSGWGKKPFSCSNLSSYLLHGCWGAQKTGEAPMLDGEWKMTLRQLLSYYSAAEKLPMKSLVMNGFIGASWSNEFHSKLPASADQVPGFEWRSALYSISFWLALLPNVLTGGEEKCARDRSLLMLKENEHLGGEHEPCRLSFAGASCCLSENFVLIIYEWKARAITFGEIHDVQVFMSAPKSGLGN